MKKLYILLILSISANAVVFSQTSSSFVYTHEQIESDILDENIDLVISLPENYDDSNANYPVVYVLDGKWFFSQGVTAQTHFSRFKMTPELIIVGVENSVDQRSWYTSNAKDFNQSIKEELIPFIDKKFRTSNERLLFGWESSGGFVIEVLGANPTLFTGYLAASPGPLDRTFSESYQYRFDAVERLLESDIKLNSSLFVTTGRSDFPAQYGVDNLLTVLNENEKEGFQFTYKKLLEESHSTSAFKTIHKGIESYFKYYPVLRVSSIEEFISMGEQEYLETYYATRKIKYSFSEERNTSDYLLSCKNIVFTAMTGENYEAFNHYIETFLPKNMLSITHYNHASMFATFYLENDNTEMAFKLMTYYTDKFPEEARPYNVLGNIYSQMKDKKNAKKYYQTAIDLGSKNADRRLVEYKNNLKKLGN